jgi:hypothetical protein
MDVACSTRTLFTTDQSTRSHDKTCYAWNEAYQISLVHGKLHALVVL